MIKYTIKEKEKIVIAEFQDDYYSIINNIRKKFKNYYYSIKSVECDDIFIFTIVHHILDYSGYLDDYKYRPKRFIAKAKCDDEDIFDVEIGKKIAKEKLLKKHKEFYNKIFIKLNNLITCNISFIFNQIVLDINQKNNITNSASNFYFNVDTNGYTPK